MPDEYRPSCQQTHQIRVEIATLQADHRAIMAQLACIPTRKDMARIVLLGTLATSGLVLLVAMLFR